jgi:hypothetical protein
MPDEKNKEWDGIGWGGWYHLKNRTHISQFYLEGKQRKGKREEGLDVVGWIFIITNLNK